MSFVLILGSPKYWIAPIDLYFVTPGAMNLAYGIA
jgi:hypothetical protein